ncbi:MAG: glycine cleavage system protein GcvH [Oscillospiraceae bacterium]|jgi:glycine cleavage system H protein
MEFPSELSYTRSHEWMKKDEDGEILVGITAYAENELGSVVFANLPAPGELVSVGEPFGDVESVKAVSDVNSPVSGVVDEINEELLERPELINEQPYESWFIKVKDVTAVEDVMNSDEYEAFVKEEQAKEQ